MSEKPLKVPPNSIEAEKSTLGALLLDKDAVIKIADFLKPDDFYYDQNGTIYEAILFLFNQRTPTDLLTLASHLKDKKKLKQVGGETFLAELTEAVPTATHILQYATIVKQKATLRRLLKAGDTITGLGFEETEDIENLLEKAEKALFGVSQTFIKDRFVHIKDILAQTYEKIADLHDSEGKDKYRGLPTGFKALDNLLSGMQPADLVVLAARPSMGKTSLALNMAQNASKKGSTIGVISLEMSKEQLVERMFCSLLGVDSWKMRTGHLTDEDFSRIGSIMDELNQTKIFIDDSPGNSMAELRAKARRLQMEHGLDLLIIDYMQLMSLGMPMSQVNRVQEISEISRSLKGLAREMKIPILALSQLSRAVEQRPSRIPQLSDLRECLAGDALIMDAETGLNHTIASLYRKQKKIPVFTLDKNYQLKVTKPAAIVRSGVKKIYKLITRTGREIQASFDHPFLTIEGWKSMEKLKIGERMAVPRRLPVAGKKEVISEERANENNYHTEEIDREKLSQLATKLEIKKKVVLTTRDVLWDQIVSIVPMGRRMTYDLVIPETHNFVANNMVVHNSGAIEQDADVVMMMYREDYYEEDSDRAGITDIFIRKHRNGPTGRVELMFRKEQMRFYDLEKQRQMKGPAVKVEF